MLRHGYIIVFCILLAGCTKRSEPVYGDELQKQSSELLYEWLDNLRAQQIASADPMLDGGILCPACNRVHGRCSDAILPMMYAAWPSKDTTYLNSAVRLWRWMEANTSTPDGAWVNDVNISDWKGTTVFSIIAIGEALMDYGDLLPRQTQDEWWARLGKAAQYVYNDEPNFSRKYKGAFNQNINYSASAPYALWIVGNKLGRKDFLAKAAEIAEDTKKCFSPNNCLLYGEAPYMGASPKGGYPVDLGYNVEESLPNLAFYARAVGDSLLMYIVGRSMLSHLEFMLPDGAWDNSWGTRSFKWTYWGSRTSDGMMGGYYLLADKYPVFLTAIERNVSLLRRATEKGMLYGGMHYHSNGQPPCNHHTFSHARGMASFLKLYQPGKSTPQTLPREEEYGLKEFRDARAWLVAIGDWRATITDLDCEYRVHGTHPKGGALSLLWHKAYGPLFAAGMNGYSLIEPTNMQMDRQVATTSPTPRIEYEHDGRLYTDINDSHAKIEVWSDKVSRFEVTASLVDADGSHPSCGEIKVLRVYSFWSGWLSIQAKLISPAPGKVRMILPFIAENSLKYWFDTGNNKGISIVRGDITVGVGLFGNASIGQTNPNGRILCYTPGFEVIPIIVDVEDKVSGVTIKVADNKTQEPCTAVEF